MTKRQLIKEIKETEKVRKDILAQYKEREGVNLERRFKKVFNGMHGSVLVYSGVVSRLIALEGLLDREEFWK